MPNPLFFPLSVHPVYVILLILSVLKKYTVLDLSLPFMEELIFLCGCVQGLCAYNQKGEQLHSVPAFV